MLLMALGGAGFVVRTVCQPLEYSEVLLGGGTKDHSGITFQRVEVPS